jgi:hypothetical protein
VHADKWFRKRGKDVRHEFNPRHSEQFMYVSAPALQAVWLSHIRLAHITVPVLFSTFD